MFDSRRKFIHQALLATAGLMLPYKKGTALNLSKKPFTLDTYHPKDCTIDLSTFYQYDLSTEIQIDDDQSYAKDPMVHKDVMYSAEAGDGKGCDPAVNSCDFYDISGENTLRYQVYYPKKTVHDYEAVRLPAIVLFHAGGFAECTNYQLPIMQTLCEELSRKGFITFSVEYRRGKVEDVLAKYTSVQSQLALYRAQQDGRGFIRSILKKQTQGLNHNNWKYLIDNTQFFVGGTSSGGVIAKSCAYYRTPNLTNQSMVDAVFPNETSSLPISDPNILGPIHADYYYGDVDTQYWPNIAGVANMWGGLPIPKEYDSHEADFFAGGSNYANPPLIAFHGVKDDTVFFKDNSDQNIKFSISPLTGFDFHSDNTCLNSANYYSVRGFNSFDGVLIKRCSSLNMYNVLKELNRYCELYYDCNMTHGLGNTADFGIGTSNNTLVTKYLAQRIAIFFQSIMNHGSLPVTFGITGRSVFRDCENFRNSCNPASNAPACTNDPASYEKCVTD